MGNARYLWCVASSLRQRIAPALGDRGASDALENCIRVLTAVANALEPGPEAPAAIFMDGGQADTDRCGGPPENLAAYRNTGNRIAHFAALLDNGASLEEVSAARAAEKALLDSALARMDAVERAARADTGSTPSSIDPDRLRGYLCQRAGCDAVEINEFRLVVGGRSRQTALFSVAGAPDLPSRLVIQRGIPGLGASDAFLGVRSQHDLLRALREAGMRVPGAVLFEEDERWLEAPFLIVEQVPGTTVQPDFWGPISDEAIVLELARQLAILHGQPVETCGLGLRPAIDAAGRAAEVEQLASAWTGRAHWPSVTMSAVISWLRANVDCVDDRLAIVHNDMLFHNILAEDGQITAVLDWEQCAIGHPAEDLGYCYPVVAATMDWGKFMAAYRDAGGADIPQRQIDFFALRGGLRLMGLVLAGGRDAFEKGISDDVLVASAGAHFSQRLLQRIAFVLHSVVERSV